MRNIIAGFVAALAVLGAAGAVSAQTMYGAGGGGAVSDLYTIDPSTGASVSVGPIGYAVTGMAYDAVGGVMYGSTSTLSPNCASCLITINLATGAGTLVGPMGLAFAAADIAWSGSVLYGWSETTDDLVTINTTTGVATVVGDSATSTAGDGMDFVGGVLYAALQDANGNLFTVDTTTGLVTAGPVMNGPGSRVAGATTDTSSGLLFAILNGSGNLATINTTTGAVNIIGATGIPAADAIALTGPIAPPIPTLSEWAMLLLAGLLAAAGALWIQRRRFAVA